MVSNKVIPVPHWCEQGKGMLWWSWHNVSIWSRKKRKEVNLLDLGMCILATTLHKERDEVQYCHLPSFCVKMSCQKCCTQCLGHTHGSDTKHPKSLDENCQAPLMLHAATICPLFFNEEDPQVTTYPTSVQCAIQKRDKLWFPILDQHLNQDQHKILRIV